MASRRGCAVRCETEAAWWRRYREESNQTPLQVREGSIIGGIRTVHSVDQRSVMSARDAPVRRVGTAAQHIGTGGSVPLTLWKMEAARVGAHNCSGARGQQRPRHRRTPRASQAEDADRRVSETGQPLRETEVEAAHWESLAVGVATAQYSSQTPSAGFSSWRAQPSPGRG